MDHSLIVALVIGATAGLFVQPEAPKPKFEYLEHLRFTTMWDLEGKMDHGFVDPDHPGHVHIRLLCLYPRLPGHPILATTHRAYLGGENRRQYEAISYTWGRDPTKVKC